VENKLIVRRYEDKDLDAVFDMINSSFTTPALDKVYEDHVKSFWMSEYTKEKIAESADSTHFYVAELDGQIVGSGGVGVEEEKAYIYGVFIDPKIQRGGIGTEIMKVLEQDELCQKYRKIFLTAALSAGRFYQKLGYTYKYDVPEIVLDGCLEVVYMEKEI